MPFSSPRDPQLLRAIILQHYQSPANKVDAPPKSGTYLQMHNKSASCIDDFTVYLRIGDGKVGEALFSGVGCAISTAAGSIATHAITGMTVEGAVKWMDNYARMINGMAHDESMLGDAVAFCTINQLPSRIRCALAVPEPLLKLLHETLKKGEKHGDA